MNKDWQEEFDKKFPYLREYDQVFDSLESERFEECFSYKKSNIKNFISNLIFKKQKEVLDMVELEMNKVLAEKYGDDSIDDKQFYDYKKAIDDLETKKKEILTKLDE